jgi:hypothetical protein
VTPAQAQKDDCLDERPGHLVRSVTVEARWVPANISRFGSPSVQTRFAFGGGIQLTVVVAKFEIGYMRSLHCYDGDQYGNIIARLVFQNLF